MDQCLVPFLIRICLLEESYWRDRFLKNAFTEWIPFLVGEATIRMRLIRVRHCALVDSMAGLKTESATHSYILLFSWFDLAMATLHTNLRSNLHVSA